jgi:hypothetical protein
MRYPTQAKCGLSVQQLQDARDATKRYNRLHDQQHAESPRCLSVLYFDDFPCRRTYIFFAASNFCANSFTCNLSSAMVSRWRLLVFRCSRISSARSFALFLHSFRLCTSFDICSIESTRISGRPSQSNEGCRSSLIQHLAANLTAESPQIDRRWRLVDSHDSLAFRWTY